MDLDVVWLSRVQFALTVMFHYLFPPLTIGLGVIMMMLEGMYVWKRAPEWEQAARFWTKIFAINFAMGVATGIVMEFQFGTNWATYSRFVGDVFGSALAAEGIFAFFLESGFLAVLVFGWDRVSTRMHFFATIMVAIGSMFSAVWIVVANSWQQTPAGFHIVETTMGARAEITDFWAMVFNPSSMDRLVHVLLGSFILGAFFVMSISAFYILKNRHRSISEKMFKIALTLGTVASLAMLVSGHSQARVVAEHQPAKLAAFEGLWKTTAGGTPLYVWGFPNERSETVDYGIAIPKLLSYLAVNDWDRPIPGLDQFPRDERPPVAVSFYSYHLMVGLGFTFIGLTLLACAFWAAGRLFQQRWLLWIFVFAIIGPFLSNQLGWVAAEVGRQPWSVYGLLRTSDSVSKAVAAEAVLASIIMFSLIYALLLFIWLYILDRKIRLGPDHHEPHEGHESWTSVAATRTDPSGQTMTPPEGA